MVSPFFGGGSVELALAARGWRVLGFDAFGPLVDFWQVALTDRMRLADEVMKHHPLTVDNFKRLQAEGHRLQTQLERAAAFYVLNRSSFSGTTCSGGMSPGHARYYILHARDHFIAFGCRSPEGLKNVAGGWPGGFSDQPPKQIAGSLYSGRGTGICP